MLGTDTLAAAANITEAPAVDVVPVHFHDAYTEEQYFLLELPTEDEEELCQLKIRGQLEDEAILCTKSRSWTIRCVCTSNKMLLCNRHPAAGSARYKEVATVMGQAANILEVVDKKTSEPGERLRSLAKQHCLLAHDGSIPQQRTHEPITLGWMKESLQLADQELATLLSQEHFVCWQRTTGEWVQLNDIDVSETRNDALEMYAATTYLVDRTLRVFLLAAVAASWDTAKMSENECIALVQDEVPAYLIQLVLREFATRTTGEDGEKWALEANRAVRFVGVQVLRQMAQEIGSSVVDTHAFMKRWRDALPDAVFGFVPALELLNGVCIVNNSNSSNSNSSSLEGTVRYFPSEELSAEPKLRFEQLYTAVPKWEHAALACFIDDIAPDSKTRDALILKYSRSSAVGDKVYLTSRFTFFTNKR